LLALAGPLFIPALAGVAIFAGGWADDEALAGAPVCSHPDRNSSACLSLFPGTIVRRNPGSSKTPASYTIAAAGMETDVVPGCWQSHGACNGFAFEAGTQLMSGWWKGSLVLLGPPGRRPGILTDDSPLGRLGLEAFLLALVILPISMLVAAPPRPVDHGLVQRVAWGEYVFPLPVAWALVYLIPAVGFGFGLIDPRWAPLLLVASGAIAAALVAWVTDIYFSDLIRTGARRTIEVRRADVVSGRGGERVVVSYQRQDGRSDSYPLDRGWKGRLKPGDHLDALTSEKSGSIRRVLSTAPAHE
jgi:hypothetical protein